MGHSTMKEDWSLESLIVYVSQIVEKESGNILGKNQYSMVSNRIKKRLIDLGNMSPADYYEYLSSHYEVESSFLVTILTTHHTFFFREFTHFEFLIKNLPQLVKNIKARNEKTLKIFCAACSKGQEVYSLAMLLEHHLADYPGIDYEITGSDIDTECIGIAKNAVYNFSEVKSIPQLYLKGNWQRGTGEIAQFAKVKNHLKGKCHFKFMNLVSEDNYFGSEIFDIIFCRNVIIYFDTQTTLQIVNRLKKHIHKGGFLITGLSESLKSLDIPKNTLAPSVYNFDPTFEHETSHEKIKYKSIIPSPIKVLTVDDSPSVLKLLSKIFQSDNEFELVGSAKNGIEAAEFVKNNKVDAMTLDIHMPEMDGVEYMRTQYKSGHPNVIIVSSASREDARYAGKTLSYGASDFVEKPSLNNLRERTEEIKNKIKMSFLRTRNEVSSIDKSFKHDFIIKNPETKSRFYFSNISDAKNLTASLKELKPNQPPIFLFFEGNESFLETVKNQMYLLQNLTIFDDQTKVEPNQIYICDFNSHFDIINKKQQATVKSVCVFGICSRKVENNILQINHMHLLLEDIENANSLIKKKASDIFPWTSFSHVSTEYLSKKE